MSIRMMTVYIGVDCSHIGNRSSKVTMNTNVETLSHDAFITS